MYLLISDVLIQSSFKTLWIINECFSKRVSISSISSGRNNVKVKRVYSCFLYMSSQQKSEAKVLNINIILQKKKKSHSVSLIRNMWIV